MGARAAAALRVGHSTLCLGNNRFEVRIDWATPTSGQGHAYAVPLTADTAMFYFFDRANIEAVVKVIDGCNYNHHFWVFAGGLTNLQTTVTIRDSVTGDTKTYTNSQGTAFQPIQEIDAFSGCDAPSSISKAAENRSSSQAVSGTSLLLNGNRFKVDVAWQTADGKTGTGHPVTLTTDTGYFWFFDASNVEMVVKVLTGCGVNGSYWVFAGGLTNVHTVLTVTDTLTGKSKTYINPQMAPFQPIQDTSAFKDCT